MKLFVVNSKNFRFQMKRVQNRSTGTVQLTGLKKFEIFDNANAVSAMEAGTREHELGLASQRAKGSAYEKEDDTEIRAEIDGVAVSFKVAYDTSNSVTIRVFGRYLQDLVEEYGKPLQLKVSTSIAHWKALTCSDYSEQVISGQNQVNKKGECEITGMVDLFVDRKGGFLYYQNVVGWIVIEMIPGKLAPLQPPPDNSMIKGPVEQTDDSDSDDDRR